VVSKHLIVRHARKEDIMKRGPVFIVILLLIVGALPVLAQENFTEGRVSRIVLLRINPGKGTDFWADVRQNAKPIFEEYKKQGVIVDYGFFTKATTENAEDWNVGYALDYANYAAIDGLAARTDPITLKFYGSREARTAAGIKRTENAKLVSSFLIRRVDPRPMGAAAAPRP
jgi:hypothetical protein